MNAPRDYTSTEAAEILRVTQETVRLYCRSGQIPGARRRGKYGDWLIPAQGLKDFLEPPEGGVVPAAIEDDGGAAERLAKRGYKVRRRRS